MQLRTDDDEGWRVWTPMALLTHHLAGQVDLDDVGVQRSDFLRQVAVRLLRSAWPAAHGTPPTAYGPLTRNDVATTADLLADGTGIRRQVAVGARRCRELSGGLAEHLNARGATVTAREFSEKLAVRVGRQLVGDAPSDPDADAQFLRDLADHWSHKPRPLDAAAFHAAHQALYDELWASASGDYLDRWPPSSIDLGDDLRPPLTRDPSDGRRDDWALGTDRSLHSRYRLALKPRGVPRSACDEPACATRGAGPADDPDRIEVLRACSPYGLAEPAHRQLLRSVHAGLGGAPQGPVDWRAALSPCTPVDVDEPLDPVVVNATAGAWRAWCAGPLGQVLAEELGDLAVHQHVAAWVLSRRGWMGLHGRESTRTPAARRCWLRTLVSDGLYRQCAPTLRTWAREGPPTDVPTRREATVYLLGRSPLVALALRDGSPGWREEYLALVDAAGGRRSKLSPADARSLIQNLLADQGAHHG